MDESQVFQNRFAQVRQAMRDMGLQTLLVHDSGRHNFLRFNYVAYLTDFISVGPETMLVIPLEDAPVLYLAPAWDVARAAEESFVADVRPFKDFRTRLPQIGGKVGLVGREAMSFELHEEIANALKQTPVNAKQIIENMARCKGPFELERVRRAAAIADAGVPVRAVNKVKDGRPHIVDMLKNGEIQLVFTTVDETRTAIADSRHIRQAALAHRVTYYTSMAGCEAAVEGMKHRDDLGVTSLQELHAELH